MKRRRGSWGPGSRVRCFSHALGKFPTPRHPHSYNETVTLPIVDAASTVKLTSMQHIKTFATPNLASRITEKTHPFKIAIAYKGCAAGFRAWAMADALGSELKPDLEIVSDLWEFALMADPQLRGCATADAAQADMAVISAGGGAEMPAHVKKWIEAWLGRKKDRPAALVALLDQEANLSGAALPLCSRLRRVAARGRVDYFCKMGDWEREEFEYVVDTVHQRSESRTAVLEEMLHQELCSLLQWITTGRHSGLPLRDRGWWPGAHRPSGLTFSFGK